MINNPTYNSGGSIKISEISSPPLLDYSTYDLNENQTDCLDFINTVFYVPTYIELLRDNIRRRAELVREIEIKPKIILGDVAVAENLTEEKALLEELKSDPDFMLSNIGKYVAIKERNIICIEDSYSATVQKAINIYPELDVLITKVTPNMRTSYLDTPFVVA